MTTVADQCRATALLELLESTKRGRAFTASADLGRRYSAALTLSTAYERRAIEWWYASNFDQHTEAMREVFTWWPDDAETSTSTTLVLEGGKGSGKTTAAVGLLLRRGGEFVRAGALQEIPLGDKGTGQLERIQKAPLLVLDNLGSEKDIGPTLARVHAIMVARDGAKLPTIITTTLVPDYRDKYGRPRVPAIPAETSFAGRYQDDVYDRVMGNGTWAWVRGESKRGSQPDLRAATKSQRRWDALQMVVEVKRGAGDPSAVDAVARAAGFTSAEIETASQAIEAENRRALSEMPEKLLAFGPLARYHERYLGPVAPAEG